MTTDLRGALMPHLQNHDWEAVSSFIGEHERDEAAKPLVVLARGLQEALEGDFTKGVEQLGEAVELGSIDARLQRALLRTFADEEWEAVIADVERLKTTELVHEDQRSLYAVLLEKIGEHHSSHRRFSEALPWWSELIERAPETAIAFQRRSRCHFHLGDRTLALADADRHLALEPNNRLAWLARAAVKRALGDVAGAEADTLAGAPFFDVHVSDEVRAQARELLAKDRTENLERRLGMFDQLELHGLDIALEVLEQEWVFSWLPADEQPLDLSFTVGLFYRFDHPELMFHSRDVELSLIKDPVTALVERIRGGAAPLKAGDTFEIDGKTITLEVPTEKDLATYPYGYGGHFYRHFMDRNEVPLLLARLA